MGDGNKTVEMGDERITLQRRSRRDVLERIPPMVIEAFEAWNEAIEAHGIPEGFDDVNFKLCAVSMIVEAVLPDAPDV